jgi:hypothetical protein
MQTARLSPGRAVCFREKVMRSFKSLFIALILLCVFPLQVTGNESVKQADFSALVGEWIRPDGGYVIQVREVKSDGSVDVGYFNPKEINISEVNISEWKGLLKLFIKLDDEGYPGSTYNLYYYAEKDALAGFYYQAVLQQKFEVVFLRKR